MKEKNTTTTDTKRGRNAAYGYKVVYVSIPESDYAAIAASARANCRSVGGELLYGWRKNHEREERESCK